MGSFRSGKDHKHPGTGWVFFLLQPGARPWAGRSRSGKQDPVAQEKKGLSSPPAAGTAIGSTLEAEAGLTLFANPDGLIRSPRQEESQSGRRP